MSQKNQADERIIIKTVCVCVSSTMFCWTLRNSFSFQTKLQLYLARIPCPHPEKLTIRYAYGFNHDIHKKTSPGTSYPRSLGRETKRARFWHKSTRAPFFPFESEAATAAEKRARSTDKEANENEIISRPSASAHYFPARPRRKECWPSFRPRGGKPGQPAASIR